MAASSMVVESLALRCAVPTLHSKGSLLAKVNYNFEKRQKEIARKKKQEQKQAEKRQRKADATDQPSDDTNASTDRSPPADD